MVDLRLAHGDAGIGPLVSSHLSNCQYRPRIFGKSGLPIFLDDTDCILFDCDNWLVRRKGAILCPLYYPSILLCDCQCRIAVWFLRVREWIATSDLAEGGVSHFGWEKAMKPCVAGKNNVAVEYTEHILFEELVASDDLCVSLNETDDGKTDCNDPLKRMRNETS